MIRQILNAKVCTAAITAMLALTSMPVKAEKHATNDSIANEGRLLYRYEKATWIVSDLAYSSSIKSTIKHSITYAHGDTITVLYIAADKQMMFEGKVNGSNNSLISSGMRFKPLNNEEKHLLAVRNNAIKQINEMGVIKMPSKVKLNIDLIPFEDGYKVYALSGTEQLNVVPFGNDYLFYTDYNGNVKNWLKFHNEYHPLMLSKETMLYMPGTSYTQEPYLTATDICTFSLYADIYPNLKQIGVTTANGMLCMFDKNSFNFTY